MKMANTSIKRNYAMNNTKSKQSKSMLYIDRVHRNRRHFFGMECCNHQIAFHSRLFHFPLLCRHNNNQNEIEENPKRIQIHAIKSCKQLYIVWPTTSIAIRMMFKKWSGFCSWLTLYGPHCVSLLPESNINFWYYCCVCTWKTELVLPMKNRIDKFDLVDLVKCQQSREFK